MRRLGLIITIVLVGFAAIWLGLRACTSDQDREDTRLVPVSIRMKWFFAGTMAPWFAGQTTGQFETRGLDLSIRPGGPENSAVKLVASGTDTFGVAGADEVLLARSRGIPIVAIAVLFKQSPIGFVAKEDSGITSPSQWAGKRVEVTFGDNAETQYRALLSKFDLTGITEVPYTFNLAPFLEDKVDVSVAYLMDQVVTLQRMGVDINIMAAKDYGVNPYGDVIITHEDTLATQRDLVLRFVCGSLKSLEFAVGAPEQAVRALTESVPNLETDNEEEVWRATIPFLGSVDQLGEMQLDRWRETEALLRQFGEYEEGKVELSKAFDLTIAPEACHPN